MIILDLYKNKNVGVIGLGKTGRSVVDSLIHSGSRVSLYDDFEITDDKYRHLFLEVQDFNWKNLDALVISPGIPILWPHKHKSIEAANHFGIPILNDIDLFQQHVNKEIVAITGTNGKSTTTAFINHIFKTAKKKSAICGNFGIPVLSLDDKSDYYVLELSSYNLESCNILGFDTSILLNITPDHLNRHGGIFGYASAKQRIFANFHEKSNAIIGVDDQYGQVIFNFLKSAKHPQVVPISGSRVPQSGVGWDDDRLIDNRFNEYKIICDKSEKLGHLHNRQNISAAYAACILNGITKEEFINYASSFKGLEHRQEIVATINGIQYINDSKATNAQSAEQALLRFDNIYWILGGRPKEDGIESLIPYFQKIKRAFLIGEVANEWYNLLEKNGVKSEVSETLDAALEHAYKFSKNDNAEVILLSPACASFDQFKNFEDRGDHFRELVKKIAGKST